MLSSTQDLGQKWNWWKIGFFVLLLAFEFTRELFVVTADKAPMTLVSKAVYGGDGYFIAEGRWRRLDGGDPLTPGITKIDCEQSRATCRVIGVLVNNRYVYPPEFDEFPARFNADGVAYSWDAGCVHYEVRINLTTRQATSIRTLLPSEQQSATSDCRAFLDDRIEMVLSDGYGEEFGDYDLPEGRFLPMFTVIGWFF